MYYIIWSIVLFHVRKVSTLRIFIFLLKENLEQTFSVLYLRKYLFCVCYLYIIFWDYSYPLLKRGLQSSLILWLSRRCSAGAYSWGRNSVRGIRLASETYIFKSSRFRINKCSIYTIKKSLLFIPIVHIQNIGISVIR